MIDANFIAVGLFSFVFHRHRRASLFFAPNRQQALTVVDPCDPLLTVMSARKPMLYVIRCLQHEVIRKNAEGRTGSTQADEGFRASGCAHVFRASEDDGGSSAWETAAPLGNFNRGQLSRSVSRAQQS
jgi:hypothetical protein